MSTAYVDSRFADPAQHDHVIALATDTYGVIAVAAIDLAGAVTNDADVVITVTAVDHVFAIAFDPESNAVIDWGVYGAPETFLIDAGGVIREKHKGAMHEQVWQQKFAPYFKGERS